MNVELAVDVVDVGFRRTVRNKELIGNVLGVAPAYQHAKHLLLASGQFVVLDDAIDFALPQRGAAFVLQEARARFCQVGERLSARVAVLEHVAAAPDNEQERSEADCGKRNRLFLGERPFESKIPDKGA